MTVVVVVGMAREARIVGAGATVIVGAAGLRRGLPERPAGVLSFGLCGGLDPALRVGDLVVASAVVGQSARFAADREWVKRLSIALPRAVVASVAAGDVMLNTPSAKAALHRASGAAAVDMESHLVAEAAQQAGVPFAVLRAVSDPAHRALPRAAQAGFGADGAPDIGAVLRALLVRPHKLPALIRTALEAERAFRTLGYARHLLGPRLGCLDFGKHGVDVA